MTQIKRRSCQPRTRSAALQRKLIKLEAVLEREELERDEAHASASESPELNKRIQLPPQVAAIYRATAELEERYPGRHFTPDGHLVGSIGEVVAAEALGLTLYPPSHRCHDAFDENGDVQIKMTAGNSVGMYSCCNRLVVLKVVSTDEAEIVYDGPGNIAWENAGKVAKNGQRSISLARLKNLPQRRKPNEE